jgi:hypothetical protein
MCPVVEFSDVLEERNASIFMVTDQVKTRKTITKLSLYACLLYSSTLMMEAVGFPKCW